MLVNDGKGANYQEKLFYQMVKRLYKVEMF
jgi:hypothetical protein